MPFFPLIGNIIFIEIIYAVYKKLFHAME